MSRTNCGTRATSGEPVSSATLSTATPGERGALTDEDLEQGNVSRQLPSQRVLDEPQPFLEQRDNRGVVHQRGEEPVRNPVQALPDVLLVLLEAQLTVSNQMTPAVV